MKRFHKKGISEFLVITILMAFIFLVLLGVYKPLFGFLSTQSVDKGCYASAVASSTTKSGVTGVVVIQLDCPLKEEHIRTLTLKDLRKGISLAGKEIDKYKLKDIKKNSLDYTNLDDRLLYNTAKIIINEEMKPCWDKLGKGRLDLFSNWYALIGYEDDYFVGDFKLTKAPKNIVASFKENIGEGLLEIGKTLGMGGVHTVQALLMWNLEVYGTPKTCVICSKITFDKAAQEKLIEANRKHNPKHPYIIEIHHWMRNMPVRSEGGLVSAYEYFMDDIIVDQEGYADTPFVKRLAFDVRKPVAVIFARENVHQLWQIGQTTLDVLGLIEEEQKMVSVDNIILYPYDEIAPKVTDTETKYDGYMYQPTCTILAN